MEETIVRITWYLLTISLFNEIFTAGHFSFFFHIKIGSIKSWLKVLCFIISFVSFCIEFNLSFTTITLKLNFHQIYIKNIKCVVVKQRPITLGYFHSNVKRYWPTIKWPTMNLFRRFSVLCFLHTSIIVNGFRCDFASPQRINGSALFLIVLKRVDPLIKSIAAINRFRLAWLLLESKALQLYLVVYLLWTFCNGISLCINGKKIVRYH